MHRGSGLGESSASFLSLSNTVLIHYFLFLFLIWSSHSWAYSDVSFTAPKLNIVDIGVHPTVAAYCGLLVAVATAMGPKTRVYCDSEWLSYLVQPSVIDCIPRCWWAPHEWNASPRLEEATPSEGCYEAAQISVIVPQEDTFSIISPPYPAEFRTISAPSDPTLLTVWLHRAKTLPSVVGVAPLRNGSLFLITRTPAQLQGSSHLLQALSGLSAESGSGVGG